MEKLLIYIKHHVKPLWKLIESCNERYLKILHKKQLSALEERYSILAATNNEFQYRLITVDDLDGLYGLLSKLDKDYVKYFNPHGFGYDELKYVLQSINFLTFGYFYNNQLVGYFMLRLFGNKKVFTARVVDPAFNGKGVGKDMARIMYRMANELGWGAYGTACLKNIASLKTHNYEIVKKLSNEFVFLKFNTKNTDW